MILPPWQHEFLHLSVLLHWQLSVIDLMLNLIDGTGTSILIVSCLADLACGTPCPLITSLQRTIIKNLNRLLTSTWILVFYYPSSSIMFFLLLLHSY